MSNRENSSVRDDTIDNVRFILGGLSSDDKCLVARIEPSKAGLTIDTAAGADGAIVAVNVPADRNVPPGVTHGKGKQTSVSPPALSSDEIFARALQAERQTVVDRVDAAVVEDEFVARSLWASDSPALSRADPLSPSHASSPRTTPRVHLVALRISTHYRCWPGPARGRLSRLWPRTSGP